MDRPWPEWVDRVEDKEELGKRGSSTGVEVREVRALFSAEAGADPEEPEASPLVRKRNDDGWELGAT